MNTRFRRNVSAIVHAAVMVSAVAGVGVPGTAEAGPAVQYVMTTSAFNSTSPKMVVAQCPWGKTVLGGAANITGAQGQVTIQAAFPTHDAGAGKHGFVVKAVEDLSGTAAGWSVTAAVYCTADIVPSIFDESSAFDSSPIKSATVQCPQGTKVVGMGGEVSTSPDAQPATLLGTIPSAGVVFQGFEVNDDLTAVTARAIEYGAGVGGSYAPSWRVSVVASCAIPYYFTPELSRNTETNGGPLADENDSRVETACGSKGKHVIATGSRIYDSDQGQWYLDRFSRYNDLQQYRIVAEGYRNPELGASSVTQTAYAICVDK